MTFIFASLPYLAIRKIVILDSYVTLSRYLLNSFAMFKSREIYHKYCLTILLNHDTSGHLARIHSSTFLSHYNILCCHTTFKNKWDPVTLPFSQNSWNVLFFLFGMETIALTHMIITHMIITVLIFLVCVALLRYMMPEKSKAAPATDAERAFWIWWHRLNIKQHCWFWILIIWRYHTIASSRHHLLLF